MFEFEDISSGFHDIFLNKYSDSSGSIMDLYVSESMQDMLNMDFRSEVATVVGGVNEFTSLMNYDLPALELDTNSMDGDVSWLGTAPKWSTAACDIYADVGACVNPNSVMPVISTSLISSSKSQLNLNTNINHTGNSPLPSPKEKKSHLTFSPNTIKLPILQENKKASLMHGHRVDAIKKDLTHEIKQLAAANGNHSVGGGGVGGGTGGHVISSGGGGVGAGGNTIKLAAGIGGLTFANSLAFTKLKHNNSGNGGGGGGGGNLKSSSHHTGNSLLHNHQKMSHHQHDLAPKLLARNLVMNGKANGAQIIRINPPNIMSPAAVASVAKAAKLKLASGIEFPKPAYSYSCLIAMALKNSRAGSLPVSEIYSFMCEHFPYFKTAPNGWKNSVRHNLSLNKCFEKIEKPTTNGCQRKGCLWAMNPMKIAKMDEEVQKWSRKDPMAIRRAMVHPEHLEQLERGEMKHGNCGDSDGENESHSDNELSEDSDVENDVVERTMLRTPDSCDEDDEQDEIDADLDGEYDVEVSDVFDEIVMEDSKQTLKLALKQKNFLSFGHDHFSSTKRARLDVNYSIASASGGHQHTNVHHVNHHVGHHGGSPQVVHQQSRRKMTLVNRIV